MFKIDKDIRLETERLLLRFLEPSDRKAIFETIAHDRQVLNYFVMDYCEKEEDLDLERMIERSVQGNRYTLAVVNKQSGEVMGMLLMCSAPNPVMNTSELGCALGVKYQAHGYAPEATRALTEHLFRKGVHKVTACHIIENTASKKCLQNAGMVFEGIRKDELFYRDRYWDVGEYYRLNPDQA